MKRPAHQGEEEEEEEDGGSSSSGLVGEITSRVLAGSKPASTRGGGCARLPRELEGDERLRSIEPKMVELIMNEVATLNCFVCIVFSFNKVFICY